MVEEGAKRGRAGRKKDGKRKVLKGKRAGEEGGKKGRRLEKKAVRESIRKGSRKKKGR